jgi:2-polyprenyl-3-methyl-5-hydroxy-6-metoxy-1,4-benzoquinol methylase
MIGTATPSGLHAFVGERVLSRYARPGLRVADLGTGPGAMAARLQSLGCDVLAVDRDTRGYQAGLPYVSIDFNQPDFASAVGLHSFSVVTAIEVIEHVESPIDFLRNIEKILAPGGVAVLTTPNVDCMPARAKFLLTGKLRMMDDYGDPTHISPIFFDLLQRQFLPLARLRMRERFVFPENGYQLTRKPIAWMLRLAAAVFPGDVLLGDHHVLVLEAAR